MKTLFLVFALAFTALAQDRGTIYVDEDDPIRVTGNQWFIVNSEVIIGGSQITVEPFWNGILVNGNYVSWHKLDSLFQTHAIIRDASCDILVHDAIDTTAIYQRGYDKGLSYIEKALLVGIVIGLVIASIIALTAYWINHPIGKR